MGAASIPLLSLLLILAGAIEPARGVPLAAQRAVAPAAVPAAVTWRPTRIVLTPTADPRTSQRVAWTTPSLLSGQRVQYRRPGGASRWAGSVRTPTMSVAYSGSSRPRYRATMTGLRAGTVYEYRIVTRRGSSAWRRFRTAGTAVRTTIVALGDLQRYMRDVPLRTVRRALLDEPGAALVLQAGDMVHRPFLASDWSDLFAVIGESGRTRSWVVSAGNHERCALVRSACVHGNAQAFRTYFDWPTNGWPGQGQTWYFVDHQGVRIVVLDWFAGRVGEQARFLDQALATNPNPWSIVLLHPPLFASTPDRDSAAVRAAWLPVIEARDVDLVLSGHEHSYARGHRTADGPVFVTSTSNSWYGTIVRDDWNAGGATPDRLVAQTATYLVIEIDGGTLRYRAVVTHRGPDSTAPVGVGGVLDSFTLTKAID